MIKELPDKWVRKAIVDTIGSLEVDGVDVPVYDYRVFTENQEEQYVLLSVQSSDVERSNKCTDFYDSTILIEIVVKKPSTGNFGSRLLADNICNSVRGLLSAQILALDSSSGLKVVTQQMSFPNDLVSSTSRMLWYRKFIRLRLKIQ